MRNRYSFTANGLHNLAVYGVEASEVWQVLHAERRLTYQVSDDASAIFGTTLKHRHLVALVVESEHEDNDWDIVAARDMYPDEIALYQEQTGG